MYKCLKCETQFSTKQNLKRHLENVLCEGRNSMKTFMDIKKEIKQGSIECEFCKKTFKKRFNFNRHLQSIQGFCFEIRTTDEEKIQQKQININKIIKNNYNKYIFQN